MKIKQWIYTTSCWNIRKQSGWNTFSYSHGLPEEDIEELERKNQIPGNLQDEYFPVFEVLTLDSGRKAICQTMALGCSFYDGRPGATLTHAFIIEPDEEWPLPPVAYIGSESFWSDLPQHLKQQALDYRDKNEGPDRPDYLPELDSWELQSNVAFSLESIGQKLNDAEFATVVNAVFKELTLLSEDQLPLRFHSEASHYNSIVASLYYLAPKALSGKNLASIYHTGGSVMQYNFFTLVGTRDSNAHVDTDGMRVENDLHPVVSAARHDLKAWYDFCSLSPQFEPAMQANMAELFAILTIQGSDTLSEAEACTILAIPQDILGDEIVRRLGMTLAQRPSLHLSANTLDLLAQVFLKYFMQIHSILGAEEKLAWRKLVHILLHSAADMTARGEMSEDDMINICRTDESYVKLWLSEKWLNSLIDTYAGQDSLLPLLRVTMQLASISGDEEQDWLSGAAGQRVISTLAENAELWQLYMQRTSDPTPACYLWLHLSRTSAGKSKLYHKAMLGFLQKLSDEGHGQARRIFLRNDAVEMAVHDAQIFMTGKPLYATLAVMENELKTYPRYEQALIASLDSRLNDEPFSSREGVWLVNCAARMYAREDLQKLLMEALKKGLYFDTLSDDRLQFVHSINTVLSHLPWEPDARNLISFLSQLADLKKQVGKDSLGAWLHRRLLPYFEEGSSSRLSIKALSHYNEIFLRYALEHSDAMADYQELMHPKWGWSQACFISACHDVILEQASHMPHANLFTRFKSLLCALVCEDDLHLLRCVLDCCGRELFADLSSKKAQLFLTELKVFAGPGHAEHVSLVEHSIRENHRSIFRKVITTLFK